VAVMSLRDTQDTIWRGLRWRLVWCGIDAGCASPTFLSVSPVVDRGQRVGVAIGVPAGWLMLRRN